MLPTLIEQCLLVGRQSWHGHFQAITAASFELAEKVP
jgi:hypothetical protein